MSVMVCVASGTILYQLGHMRPPAESQLLSQLQKACAAEPKMDRNALALRGQEGLPDGFVLKAVLAAQGAEGRSSDTAYSFPGSQPRLGRLVGLAVTYKTWSSEILLN